MAPSDNDQELNPVRVLALGAALVGVGTAGFYFIPGMLLDEAGGYRTVNAFYCAVMTLTTVGFGDICPVDPDVVGHLFLFFLCFGGLGFFCGPMMTLTSSWKTSVPGGFIALASLTLALGAGLFAVLEDMPYSQAVHLSLIAGTTIGYGNVTPATNLGRIGTAVYALMIINIIGGLLEPGRRYLESFCMQKSKKQQ